MASPSTTPVPPPPGRARSRLTAEDFIERQLNRTRTQVKLVDFASSLMLLAAGVLAFLLLLAVVDHWLFDLGFWGRLAGLLLLVLGVAYFLATRVVPLLVLRINPMYAARAIEQTAPTLKNSLINFLMFRAHREEVNEAVYQTLQIKAASDLTRVPVDTAVDRSRVIQIGYLLAAVLACAALYKIVSPKDPLQTASRVAAPWSDVARPTRVEIQEVRPGDVTVFRGGAVTVAARISGVRTSDRVVVSYSSQDRQIVGQEVPMKLDANGLWYQCTLPPGDDGCQQELVYWVRVRDGRSPYLVTSPKYLVSSPEYLVTVSPAPVIVVESVEYEFPEYTGRSNQAIQGQGDIRALEGTRVTVRARSNQPIRRAYLEFDPALDAGAAQVAGSSRLPMEFDRQSAWCSFTLQLDADRRTSQHQSYQLTYVTAEGHSSQKPVVHRIEVIPDYGPEIEVLTPRRDRVEVPENGSQEIEIRAVDPDYGLSRVTLRAVAGGAEVLDEVLFEEPQGRLGQTVVRYDFRPQQLGLAAGDRVVYWGLAEDNRIAPAGNSPEPNSARTRNRELLIVAGEPETPAGADARPGGNESPQARNDSPEAVGAEDPAGAPGQTSAPADAGDPSASQAGESQDQQGGPQPGGAQEQGSSEEGAGGGAEGQAVPGQAKPGDAGSGQPGGETPQNAGGSRGEPTPGQNEPLHDGEVFEKALERLKQQRQEPGSGGEGQGEAEPGEPGSADGAGSTSPAGNQGRQSGSAGQQEGTAPKDPNLDAGNPQGPRDGGAEQPQGPPPQQPDANRGAGSQKQAAPGEGGVSGKGRMEPDRGEKPPVPGQPDQREKEPGIGDSGDAGAGQNSQDTSGSGAVEMTQDQAVENRDRKKTMNPDSAEPQPEDAPGTTTSRRQSDTEGGASGDQSGGGKKGPGQGANQPGNDSAGSNSASDDGAGAAPDAGVGETAGTPGKKQRADGKTGSSGTEKGAGSQTLDDPTGEQTGGATRPDQNPPGDPPAPRPDGAQGGEAGSTALPEGGGLPSDNQLPADLDKYLEVPEGDDANLEYARRATDLVLDYLKDQQGRPDRRLLDELGWTDDDLKSFLSRWQQLREAAREDPASQRELDEALRSLGLRAGRDRLREGAARSDRLEGLGESGDESAPPPAYRRQFDAFKKGGP